MQVVYDTRTGNVRRFVGKLGVPSVEITDGLIVDEPFVLVTYTDMFGEVPRSTARFLAVNYKNMVGVASSGNRNWGNTYAMAGDRIAQQHNVPLLLKFELSGTARDIQLFGERMLEVEQAH